MNGLTKKRLFLLFSQNITTSFSSAYTNPNYMIEHNSHATLMGDQHSYNDNDNHASVASA